MARIVKVVPVGKQNYVTLELNPNERKIHFRVQDGIVMNPTGTKDSSCFMIRTKKQHQKFMSQFMNSPI